MANQSGDIVSANTIIKWLKQQKGFTTRKDRILPSLDKAAMLRHVVWAHSFWIFWYSAKYVRPEVALFVLVHMDEKWFYAVKTRSNCKILTSIGLAPAEYYAHHKNHIGKEMYIVVTAYVLKNGNDITKGGVAVPISLVCVGKMVTAKRNTYKRVYRDNGTYHYPPIKANLLCRAGEEYFKPCELNGSKEGTPTKPKISLLKAYKEQIIPDLEEKIVRKYSNNGQRRIVIVKQEDGAGLHQDKTYLTEMRRTFDKKGWLLFNQASQSPLTNVHDSSVFPMMSKAVSTLQALNFGSTLMKGEELNKTVTQVWENEANILAMSRAFAGHHQIVLSIMHHNGDNKYLSEKGGLSFGVRKTYVPDHEGKGVIEVPLAPTSEAETTTGAFLNERTSRGMKYPLPDVKSLDKYKLDKCMVRVLDGLMDKTSMPQDLKDVWEDILQNADTESEIESENETEIVEAAVRNDDIGNDNDGSDTESISSQETRGANQEPTAFFIDDFELFEDSGSDTESEDDESSTGSMG